MPLLHTINEVKFKSKPGQDEQISKLAETQNSFVSALKKNRSRPVVNQCVSDMPKDQSVPHKCTSSYSLKSSPQLFQFYLNWDWLEKNDTHCPSKQTILKVLLSISSLLKPDKLFAETKDNSVYQLRHLICYTGSYYLIFEKGSDFKWVCLNDK